MDCLTPAGALSNRALSPPGLLLQEGRLDAVSLLCLTALPSFCLLFGTAVALEVAPAWQGVLRYDGSLWGCVLLSCLGSVLYNLASFCVLSLWKKRGGC